MLFAWRNGPIEDAHASLPSKRRKNLHDGVMLARNARLTRQAFDALGSSEPFRLLELEDVILDRGAIWPGCDGTLTDFGRGFLGEIKKHVKRRTGTLMHFEEQLPHDDFLIFMVAPQLGTHDGHFGMPKWPACVEAAIRRLRGEDEEFLPQARRPDGAHRAGPGRGHRRPGDDRESAAERPLTGRRGSWLVRPEPDPECAASIASDVLKRHWAIRQL